MKEYWITNSRFKLIVVILVIMWLGIMILLFTMGDAVRKNPCQVCAKHQNEEVICTIGNSGYIISRTYYPNGTIVDNDFQLLIP